MTTESSSSYDHLEQMSIHELLTNINREDSTVPAAIARIIPSIEPLIEVIVKRMDQGEDYFISVPGRAEDWE